MGAALGTGVGMGIIDDGRLVRGGTNAIEGGHMVRGSALALGWHKRWCVLSS